MSRSNDAGHFFQTTASIEDAARKDAKKKNKNGNPIKLPSKLLAVAAGIEDACNVYVAEAAGSVKRVNVESGEVINTYRLAASPITSLGIGFTCLYAGAWDKNVYGRGRTENNPNGELTFSGHTDFVKAVISVFTGTSPLVISGSADATIIVWDALSGRKLHTLKGHTRGVQALAVESREGNHATIFSGDSSREIRRWYISAESCYEIPFAATDFATPSGTIEPLLVHETSIYGLVFDSDGDLWTASADKTAKCLSRTSGFKVDTVLQHPDFVRAIAIYEAGGVVVTACRDENVRIWEKGSGRLVHVYEGHFEEVTGLIVDEERGRAVSVSIDGTIRTWGLKGEDIKKAKEDAEKARRGEMEEEKKESMLTAEEEAELAELMGDDDDD